MSNTSIKSLFDEAKTFYEGQEPPYDDKAIDKFELVAAIEPSDDNELEMVSDSNRIIGKIKDDKRKEERKISNESIEYYERAVEGYELLIKNAKGEIKKIETKLNIQRRINSLQYVCGSLLFRIGQIRVDQINTQTSRINNVSSEMRDPKKDFEKAISMLKEIDSKERVVVIQKNNLLGVIKFSLYQISGTNNELSEAKIFFNLAIGIDFDEIRREETEDDKKLLVEYHYVAKYNKGFALYREKRFEEAKDNFYARYRYDNSILATVHLADTYLNLKDYDTALEFYKESYRQYHSAYSLNGMAMCYLYRAEAKVADISATNSLDFLGMRKLLSVDGVVPFEEIDSYAIMSKQSMVESLLIIATARLKQENRDGALPLIRKAIEIVENYDLGFIGPSFLGGIMLMEMNKFKPAKKIFETIVRSHKDYAEAYTALGVCHYNIGDIEHGKDQIKKALELQPNYTPAHLSLYKMEVSESKSSTSEFGEYWTKSPKRIGVLAAVIFIGIVVMVHAIQFPDRIYNNTTITNYTKQQGNLAQDINETTTITQNSNLNQLRLAIIIAVILVILWPSIKMIRFGTSNIEIEKKITQLEAKEEIYLSWIPEDLAFSRGRLA